MSTLRQAMVNCGRYESQKDIDATIKEMKKRISEGENPDDVLADEGFEPDYIFDLI